MAKWKNLFSHVTANVDSGGDAAHGANQSMTGAGSPVNAAGASAEQNEKIDFAMKFVDTLSALEAGLHTSDDPEEIAQGAMQVACDFYEADWCGFLTVDLELGLWTPFWWYNTKPSDHTIEFSNEFESAAKLARWITAMRNNDKVYVCDAEVVRKEFPEECEVYDRLGIKTVLAVPVKPRPLGFLAVRNPKHHCQDDRMLRMLAYVVLNAINQYTYLESAKMTLSPDAIESDRDIIFNAFGSLEFYTSKGVIREPDCKAPKCCRVVAYLMLHRKATHPPLEIAEALWPEESLSSETASVNIRALIYRFRQAFALISNYQLIESTPNGYRINPDLRIMTDMQQFDKLWDAIQDTPATSMKIDLIKQAIALYKGQLFEDACSEHWILPLVQSYNIRYIGLVNELLTKLAEGGDYAGIQKYASRSLDIIPGNIKAHYWLVYAMYHSGAIEMARSELTRAKSILSQEEYDTLMRYLKKNPDMAPVIGFDEDFTV